MLVTVRDLADHSFMVNAKAASNSSTDQGGGKRRSGHEAMFLLFEEFFVELF